MAQLPPQNEVRFTKTIANDPCAAESAALTVTPESPQAAASAYQAVLETVSQALAKRRKKQMLIS